MKPSFRLLVLCLVQAAFVHAQTPLKNVTAMSQTWLGVITQTKFNAKWSLLADLHIRRNNFLKDPSFTFVRAMAGYSPNAHLTLALGYGHMWLSPATAGWSAVSNEHRISEQVLFSTRLKKRIDFSQRLRNEQRWQQLIANDKRTGAWRFTNRIRYQVTLVIPLFKNPKWPALSLADELAIHFGKQVLYNTYDQNRMYIGFKQKLSKNLAADLGYMRVFQEKYAALQYERDHVLRLFIFYNSTVKKRK